MKAKKILNISMLLLIAVFVTAFSNNKTIFFSKKKKVLILGNSITHHDTNAQLGWTGNWGMAASSEQNDFVHILEKKIKVLCPQSVVYFKNIADYENAFWTYNLENFKSMREMKPDMIILKIGENVKPDSVTKKRFQTYYRKLIEYFTKNNKNVRVVCVTTFWENDELDRTIKQVAVSKKACYVQLNHLSLNANNTAIGKFKDPGVAAHPSDRGMAAIANAIWSKIYQIK